MSAHTNSLILGSRSIRDLINHHQNLKLLVREFKVFWKETLGKINPNGKKLLCTKGLIDLGVALGTSFINILIWRKTQSIPLIVLYNITFYLAIYVAYGLPVFLVRVKKTRFLRLGILLYLVMFIFLATNNTLGRNLVLFIGLLQGLACGAFWIANNSLTYENTDDDNRDKFFALDSINGGLISIVSPMVLSLVFFGSKQLSDASLSNSYFLLFILTIILLITAMFFSFKIPSGYFEQIEISNLIEIVKDKVWNVILIREAFGGIRDGVEGFIPSLLIFSILGSEFNISVLSLAFSIIGILVSLRLALVLKRENRLFYAFIGSVLFIVSRSTYIRFFSLTGMVIGASIELFANPLFGLGLASTFFDAIDHSSRTKHRPAEYIYVREVALMIGRVLGCFLILFVFNLRGGIESLKISYLILSFIPFIYFLLTYIFERKFKTTNE